MPIVRGTNISNGCYGTAIVFRSEATRGIILSDFIARRIVRIGHSIGVTLPVEELRKLGFIVGDIVAITPQGRNLIISHVSVDTKGQSK